MSPYRTPAAPPERRDDPLDLVVLVALALAVLVMLVWPERAPGPPRDAAPAITCPPFCEVDVAPVSGHRLRAACACSSR